MFSLPLTSVVYWDDNHRTAYLHVPKSEWGRYTFSEPPERGLDRVEGLSGATVSTWSGTRHLLSGRVPCRDCCVLVYRLGDCDPDSLAWWEQTADGEIVMYREVLARFREYSPVPLSRGSYFEEIEELTEKVSDLPLEVPEIPVEGAVLEPGGYIYLAVPYSDPDPAVRESRFNAVNRAAGFLMASRIYVFSPISHTHPIALACDLPKDWEFWQAYGRAMLRACGKLSVLMQDGWQDSVGVQAEIAIAREMGLPVEFIEHNQVERRQSRRKRYDMENQDSAASVVRSDTFLAALRKCVDAAELYPTTMQVATEPVAEVRIGDSVWRVDIAICKQSNEEVSSK